MKSKHIPYIIILVLIIVGVGLFVNTDTSETTTVDGRITDLSDNNQTITITTNSGSSTTASITNNTTVVDTNGSTTQASALRVGFLVKMTARHGEGTVAKEITIVARPPVLAHSPIPGAEVTSPLSISGEARGTWFFEANMTVQLENEEGETIARKGIQADGEWMTEDYVPFSGSLSFSRASVTPGTEGTLVFEKANPSGLPENADRIEIPVVFASDAAGGGSMNLDVYFGKDIVGTDVIECDAVFAVEREVEKTQAVGRAALEELLSGPTTEEQENRYITNIPDGVTLQSLRIEDKTAYADFSEELDKNVGGSCRVTAIRKQIEETLKQFSTVDEVVISINGETETILQP